MTNPDCSHTAANGASAADPEDAPDFCERFLEQMVESLQQDDPVFVRRRDLLEWSSAAGFEHVELSNLGDDCWEIRFRRGTNTQCVNVAEVERWLGCVARGCGCRLEPGQFLALVLGDRVAARMKLRPREPVIQGAPG